MQLILLLTKQTTRLSHFLGKSSVEESEFLKKSKEALEQSEKLAKEALEQSEKLAKEASERVITTFSNPKYQFIIFIILSFCSTVDPLLPYPDLPCSTLFISARKFKGGLEQALTERCCTKVQRVRTSLT